MSFPTHSTPCFTWHLPTDSLVFCAPALLLLGLTPETAPRTMADFLDRLPEPQRRFLQRQRQMALAGQGPGCLSCAYTYNGRHVREDLSIIQCDADGRPQTILPAPFSRAIFASASASASAFFVRQYVSAGSAKVLNGSLTATPTLLSPISNAMIRFSIDLLSRAQISAPVA